MIARSTRSGRMKAKESHVKCAFPCKFPVLSVVVGEQVLACLDVHHHAQEVREQGIPFRMDVRDMRGTSPEPNERMMQHG